MVTKIRGIQQLQSLLDDTYDDGKKSLVWWQIDKYIGRVQVMSLVPGKV